MNVVCILFNDYQVEAEGLFMDEQSCLWLNHLVKQISFSVSSNMN